MFWSYKRYGKKEIVSKDRELGKNSGYDKCGYPKNLYKSIAICG
jgi:hypothetical protein